MPNIARRALVAGLPLAALLSTRSRLAGATANAFALSVEYEADSLIGRGERAAHGRLWRTATAFRHEGNAQGQPQTLIVRLDRQIGWLLLAEARIAIETDLSALDLPADILDGGGGLRQTRLGREPVNGLDTTKLRVERQAESGARFSGHAWVTRDGIIGRIEGEGESRGRRGRTLMNFHNVAIRPQPRQRFEPPAGVQLVRIKGADLGLLMESLEALGQGAQRR
ncbi:MAG: hypothetical protein FJX57_04815 [Alphaproteobacteria bacterium]|nr:hypothetical protein [Alphaproteobacteria bacterium]